MRLEFFSFLLPLEGHFVASPLGGACSHNVVLQIIFASGILILFLSCWCIINIKSVGLSLALYILGLCTSVESTNHLRDFPP